jgi:glutamate--cysteine ligase
VRVDARLDRLRALAFAPRPAGAARLIGAEIEWIPVDPGTARIVPVATSAAILREAGRGEWCEEATPSGAPRFVLADRSALSFEPGGQIEYSSPASVSASEVVRRMRAVMARIQDAGGERMTLLSIGLDPVNPPERVSLQLGGARYCGMDAYFQTIGPAGPRMMRQTAAYQVSLDPGSDPVGEWRLLNALAPYVVAIFANSRRYAGQDTGYQSYRAQTWRTLDPSRTGVLAGDGDPAAEYLEFALGARTILDPSHAPFGELALGDAAWETHLTTLFPEVRPRGTFEVRSADAIEAAWYVAPLALLGGLVYDARSARAAAALVGRADPDLLVRAGAVGLGDPGVAGVARELTELAMQGVERLGAGFLDPEDVEQAVAFFDRYTRRGRSPADDSRQ